MPGIHFYKMHGAGNDFVLIDGRSRNLPENFTHFIPQICKRHVGVGADGLMILDDHPDLDFRLSYFNADGSVGEMCGNGARCAAALAFRLNIAGRKMTFAIQGVTYHASIGKQGEVGIAMQPVVVLLSDEKLQHLLLPDYRAMFLLEVGAPHLVVEAVSDLSAVDVEAEGKRLRNCPDFQPRGCNVNFVSRKSEGHINIRTYERGVEAETMACGTGAVAAATFFQLKYGLSLPLTLQPPGGVLVVNEEGPGCLLTGPAVLVFEADIELPLDK